MGLVGLGCFRSRRRSLHPLIALRDDILGGSTRSDENKLGLRAASLVLASVAAIARSVMSYYVLTFPTWAVCQPILLTIGAREKIF